MKNEDVALFAEFNDGRWGGGFNLILAPLYYVIHLLKDRSCFVRFSTDDFLTVNNRGY